jgi:hypothetical protein
MPFFRNRVRLAAYMLAGACLPAQAEVFINEFHYDNAGTDAGERIEVVATAGESLVGYRIYLYNGTGATTAATFYANDPLPAGSLVACGATVRIATIAYPPNGVQNGANDGIALVSPAGAVLQFLSYEGGIRASNGPAAGRTSIALAVPPSAGAPAQSRPSAPATTDRPSSRPIRRRWCSRSHRPTAPRVCPRRPTSWSPSASR